MTIKAMLDINKTLTRWLSLDEFFPNSSSLSVLYLTRCSMLVKDEA